MKLYLHMMEIQFRRENSVTTSEKLEVALKRQGFTQKELAERLGTSQQNVSKKFKFNDWRESDIKKSVIL